MVDPNPRNRHIGYVSADLSGTSNDWIMVSTTNDTQWSIEYQDYFDEFVDRVSVKSKEDNEWDPEENVS